MKSERVESVVKKLCRISQSCIIGDEVDNWKGKCSLIEKEHLHFQHPFNKYFTKEFPIVSWHDSPSREPALHGFLTARKARADIKMSSSSN